MARLYPPVIEHTVPASYMESNGMVKITIPFSMNRTVIASQVGGFELKIKTMQTGTHLYTIKTLNPSYYQIDQIESQVIFYLQDEQNKLRVGEFYKVQIAYIQTPTDIKTQLYNQYITHKITLQEYENEIYNKSTIGYYSDASIMKYTTKPKLYINNFNHKIINNYTHSYTGFYDQTSGDITEKVYSYCFNIYNKNKNIIFSSGECIHNNSLDSNPEVSFDQYENLHDLEYDQLYYIDYTVITINKLHLSSPKYKLIQRETINPEIEATLKPMLNFDNGYIDIYLIPSLINKQKVPATGSFVLSRASEESDYNDWEELHKFKIYETYPEGLLYRDLHIEQGKKYKYSLQQFNDYDLFSKRILSEIIISDFEDAFLYDEERQLKINYNLKMNKFSTVISESKQETIGNSFPYIMRNSKVNYKEFPIGGLISYFMDEEHLFMSKDDLITDEKTINYTTDNIAQERIFRTEVLDWLNNGKPKVFKSPTEGNFIVRLMKVSLQPQAKLGRLLHSFSCTASEIAKYNNLNLQKLNFINTTINDLEVFQQITLDLTKYSPNQIILFKTVNNAPLCYLKFENMIEGDIVNITYRDQSQESFIIGATGSLYIEDLTLDATGMIVSPRFVSVLQLNEKDFGEHPGKYFIQKNGNYEVAKTYDNYDKYYMISNEFLTGFITYGYKTKQDNSFGLIKTVDYPEPTFRQFIGEHDILKEINYISEDKLNPKSELTEFYNIKVTKRPIDRIIAGQINTEDLTDNGEFYYGALNENGNNRSERFPLIELMYPIGLRAYKPCTYYTYNDGVYNQEKDPQGVWQPNITYYLKGRYEKTQYPVGLISFSSQPLFIKTDNKDELGNNIYEKAKEWKKNETYYHQYKTVKGKIFYVEAKYVTIDDNYLFNNKDKVFYRETSKRINGQKIYTIAKQFRPEFYEQELYYELINIPEEDYYTNAYVTINDKYVYEPYQYYLHIFDEVTGEDGYQACEALEFNINEIFKTKDELATAEYEGEVLKYYKMKTILPHIFHQVGIEWTELDKKLGYDGKLLYHFEPKKYKDFYNNKDYALTDYQPYIEINGNIINVNDTIEFNVSNLKDLKNLISLKSGNGVVVDVVYQTKNYNYIIEDTLSEAKSYATVLENIDVKLENLSLTEDNDNYVNLNDLTENLYKNYYNNTFQKNSQTFLNYLNEELYNYLYKIKGDQIR